MFSPLSTVLPSMWHTRWWRPAWHYNIIFSQTFFMPINIWPIRMYVAYNIWPTKMRLSSRTRPKLVNRIHGVIAMETPPLRGYIFTTRPWQHARAAVPMYSVKDAHCEFRLTTYCHIILKISQHGTRMTRIYSIILSIWYSVFVNRPRECVYICIDTILLCRQVYNK